jgi:hypothetical protein
LYLNFKINFILGRENSAAAARSVGLKPGASEFSTRPPAGPYFNAEESAAEVSDARIEHE